MDWSGRIALTLYRSAGYLLRPLTPVLMAVRRSRGKESPKRQKERYGYASLERPSGPLVWVHAASVGETNAVMPLIEQITETGTRVLLTTGTLTSAKLAQEKLPAGAIHQFVPLDLIPYVNRFLDHWQPDMALFVESELWPTIMTELNHKDIPLIIVNGRMSDRSFQRWKKMPFAVNQMFANVPLCLVQTQEDQSRFRELGVQHVEVTGNLKFDAPPLSADEQDLTNLRAAVAKRPIWVAASTHPGEENLFAETHKRMVMRLPQLLTIIVPRHPERGTELSEQLSKIVPQTVQRTSGQPLTADTGIYICDTLGELGLFYRLSRIAFLGGSLINHGGQNPIEPARLGCALLHGPNVQNFKEIYQALDASGGAECITTERDLIQTLERLFNSSAEVHRRSELARQALRPFSGALDTTIMALTPFLNPLKINAELNRATGEGLQ
ncbi:MAG: 3-deoxy-D-manno-octulosonic acid transferase [Cohaesibacter sp.]|jgi:3-deoxy-D-manno-octulosonic-acid transferase|nr:3-deoxy-D-manno-octulosonic acid transferase [Cohaesibacter sp.]